MTSIGDVNDVNYVNEDVTIRNSYTKFHGTFDMGWFGDKYEEGPNGLYRKNSYNKCKESCGVNGTCTSAEQRACLQSSINQKRMMQIAESTLQNEQATNIRVSTIGKDEHNNRIRYLVKRILLHQHLSKQLKEYSDRINAYLVSSNKSVKPTINIGPPPNWDDNITNYSKKVLDAPFGIYPTPWKTQEHYANQQNHQNTSAQQQYNP